MNDWIRDHITWFLGVFAIIGLGYFEARLHFVVAQAVEAEVNQVGGVTPDQLALVDRATETNARQIESLENRHKDDSGRLDSKIERIVDILLED